MNKKYPFPFLNAIGYDPYRWADEYYFDIEAADRVIKFFKNELTFSKDIWKGEPFIPYPAQEERLRCIFGWKRKSDGKRRYRVVFLYIPRKNGKSEECAGIACYCFFCDGVNDAEIYIGARDRGQASTLYNMTASMIAQNPSLETEVIPYATTKEIRATWDNSKIQAISGDALSQHSLSPSVGLIDELHAHYNGDLLAAIRTGMGGRQEPLLIIITTADIDRVSVCNDELTYAREVRSGVRNDPRYLPIIYETKKDADWRDEKVWIKANPNYPVTPNQDYMVAEALRAESSARILSEFKRYSLNMITSSVEGWINMDFWRIGSKEFAEEELSGKDCYVAFDLGSKIDLSALVAFFPEYCRLICRFYCPQAAINEDRSGHYQEWLEDGELIVSGEDMTDYRILKDQIIKWEEQFNILKCGFDPHNANQLVAELMEEVFTETIEEEKRLFKFVQNYGNYTEPCKEFEALIQAKKLKHNSRILDWMAANVTVREGPSRDLMPQKPKRNSALKIDGIAAAIMAVGLWITEKPKEDKTVRGQLVYNLEDYLDDEDDEEKEDEEED